MENASLLRLEPAGKKDKKYLKALYKRAFPRAERKPFYMFGKKSVFLYIIKYDGAPAGLMAGCEFKDMLFIDYFAIDESMRGKGLGGQALSLLFSRFPGRRIFLEIEDPEIPSDNGEQRLRRRTFYLKNGFEVSDLKILLCGVQMLILCAGGNVNFNEYVSVYEKAYGRFFTRLLHLEEI